VSDVTLVLPDAVVEQIAQRVAEILAERQGPAPGPWLSVADAAALLGVDHKTVRSEIRAGRLPVIRLGRAVRIREADLAQLGDSAMSEARTSTRRLRAVRSTGEFTQRAKGQT
jgi:excisionase family DNA binding protein